MNFGTTEKPGFVSIILQIKPCEDDGVFPDFKKYFQTFPIRGPAFLFFI